MNTKEKIEELEHRIKELEARPLQFPTYIPYPVYPAPVYPYVPSWPAYPSPILPTGPVWISDAGAVNVGDTCSK